MSLNHLGISKTLTLVMCALILTLIGPFRAGAEAQGVWRFDFGTKDSPVAEGWTQVTKDTLYSEDRGYGWEAAPPESDKTPAKSGALPGSIPGLFDRDREVGSRLDRDLVMALKLYHPLLSHAFRVKVPDGDYEIAVLSGDAKYRANAFTVKAEGAKPVSVGETPSAMFQITVVQAAPRNGHLRITFNAVQSWAANALLIYPRAEADEIRRKEAVFFNPSAPDPAEREAHLRFQQMNLDGLRAPARDCLLGICDWILERDLGSGTLKGVKDTEDSIFINGNLARVLISAYRITKQRRYLEEALRWCDYLVSAQQPVITGKGKPGGWWSDVGPNRNIYLADTGTATSPLALALGYAKGERRARYLDALTRYVTFVREGTKDDPQGQGRQASSGWIIEQGKDAGAFGCGYYRGHLSEGPYSISTATTGCLMLSQLFAATKNEDYRRIALNGAAWLLRTIPEDGRIPYVIDGHTGEATWGTLSYCAEGLLAVHMLAADEKLKKEIQDGLKPAVANALREQSESGIWGTPRSGAGERSGLVPQLLLWYYNEVEKQPDIERALRKTYAFLFVPRLSLLYGVKDLVRPTGFVGLAVADFIEPGVTLRYVQE